jgi:hypothetical protein
VKNKQGFTPLDLANGKGGANGAAGLEHESTSALLAKLGGVAGPGVAEKPENVGASTKKGEK